MLISKKDKCRGARVAISVVLRPLLGTMSEPEQHKYCTDTIFQAAKTIEASISGSLRNSSCHATGDGTQGHEGGPGTPLMNSIPLSPLIYGICERRLWAPFFLQGCARGPMEQMCVGLGAPSPRCLATGTLILRAGQRR